MYAKQHGLNGGEQFNLPGDNTIKMNSEFILNDNLVYLKIRHNSQLKSGIKFLTK